MRFNGFFAVSLLEFYLLISRICVQCRKDYNFTKKVDAFIYIWNELGVRPCYCDYLRKIETELEGYLFFSTQKKSTWSLRSVRVRLPAVHAFCQFLHFQIILSWGVLVRVPSGRPSYSFHVVRCSAWLKWCISGNPPTSVGIRFASLWTLCDMVRTCQILTLLRANLPIGILDVRFGICSPASFVIWDIHGFVMYYQISVVIGIPLVHYSSEMGGA